MCKLSIKEIKHKILFQGFIIKKHKNSLLLILIQNIFQIKILKYSMKVFIVLKGCLIKYKLLKYFQTKFILKEALLKLN